MIDIHVAAKKIGIPVQEWKGRCYEIACALVQKKVVKGTAVYGHWIGPVNKRCEMFYGKSQSVGFVQHGWIVQADGTVVDPTRWFFEMAPPYIFEGHPDDAIEGACMHCGCLEEEHDGSFFRPCVPCGKTTCPDYERSKRPAWPYDEGGNAFRNAVRQPPPEFKEEHRRDLKITDKEVRLHLERLIPEPRWSTGQMFWLANLPYDAHGMLVWKVYQMLIENDLEAAIPIDNRMRAEREYGSKKRKRA